MLLCQFLVLAGNRQFFVVAQEIGFGCTYYYVLRVPYSCDFVLVFLVLAGNSYLVLRTYLVYNTVVRLCQFFGCGGK